MRLIEYFFGLLAPSRCLYCSEEGSLLCYYCREDALPETASRCYKCNRLTDFGAVCSSCRRKTSLGHVWFRTEYSGGAKDLVYKMKFSYSGEAADLMAQELVNTIPALRPATIVVHVPTITNHVRQRGFDHAKRMASILARQSGLQHVSALARLGQHRQVGSKRQQRLESVAHVFRTRQNYLLTGARVLLVDDVLTTGATLEAAAKTLKAAGAKSVDAAVFARAASKGR